MAVRRRPQTTPSPRNGLDSGAITRIHVLGTQYRLFTEPNPTPSSPGLPANGEFDPDDYCARRLAGLETGPAPTIGPGTAASIWALFALATAFIVLRIYCKIWQSRGIWWDDLTMFLASSTLCQLVINLGFGHFPCDIPTSHHPLIAFRGGGLGSTFTVLAIVWSKTAFGITLLRLTRDRLRWALAAVVVAMNVTMGLQAVFVWVRCQPVEKNWRPGVVGTCWELGVSNGYAVFSAVLSGVCDVVFALLPWFLVWRLRMRKKEKVGVVVAMSMGVFAGITSFVKSGHIREMGSKNFTPEIATTIMASCIPVLRVLFRDLRDATPTEISGTFGLENYHYPKSDSTGVTAKQAAHDPVVVEAAAPAENGHDDNTQAPNQSDLRRSQTAPKTWRAVWDVGKSARPRARSPTGGSGTPTDNAAPAPPDIQPDNSSQRVLVNHENENRAAGLARFH
ncbi:hypothetical protein CHGG_02331 [Chaetomium globosum CBS 148.51]|uniref:Rhodopsin domain-containing protein n=1 Tax=Chaetomium globosum (strain ATCC 6205 / CBS 148.51 / DSM 1962 / NBRC 6347 / NRRL 1970) TaxID=306901 RepID=Q2HBS3_CHAGB|nr:uncharacterized protein CHGG_02331 [Chaetomium globosum CBS 148.51]EAQ90396.1 hypothetical protein CHGG_02331 [Chaetomium globosum CBS 148.51]